MGVADLAWILVFAGIAAAAVRISVRLYGTVASPLGFYVLGNSFSAVLYHLRLLAYPDASLRVHGLVILSMLVFAIAAVLASGRGRPAAAARDDRGLAAFFYASSVVAVVGWALPLSLMLMRHGATHLLANLWLLEYEFQMQYIGHLNVLNILIFPTYVLKRQRLGGRRIDGLLLALSFLGLFLAGIKSFLVYSLAAGMLAYSVGSARGIRVWHLAAFGTLVIGFFVAYDKLIDVLGSAGLPGSSFPAALRFLERPYYYFTGAWPAMDMILQGQIDPAPVPGFVTFQPFWKIVADFFGVVEPIPRALPFVPVGPYFFNVYSLAGEVYWDWGVPGVVVFSAAIGGGVTALFRRAREGAYWGAGLLYALMGYGVVISFFLYFFRFTMLNLVLYTLAGGYLATGVAMRLKEGRRDS